MAIFISYRRDDPGVAYVADSLYHRLAARYGQASVFKDVDTLAGGTDFRSTIASFLAHSRVLLVLIGSQWLGVSNVNRGRHRIDDAGDFVRMEVEIGLQRGIVLPVLVQGATMPASSELPASISKLSDIQALTLRPAPDFERDMARLLSRVAEMNGLPATPSLSSAISHVSSTPQLPTQFALAGKIIGIGTGVVAATFGIAFLAMGIQGFLGLFGPPGGPPVFITLPFMAMGGFSAVFGIMLIVFSIRGKGMQWLAALSRYTNRG